MAADVLKSTAVILFNFSAMPTVRATNPPQTQSTLTLAASIPKHTTTTINYGTSQRNDVRTTSTEGR